MEDKQVPTTVTIYGVEYRLRGTEDPEFAQSVAQMVDQRMREVAMRMQTASQTRVAVMALLNVVGELLRERERGQKLEGQLGGKVRELGNRVEEVLLELA